MRVVSPERAMRNAVMSLIVAQMVCVLAVAPIRLSNRAAVTSHLIAAGFGAASAACLCDRARRSAMRRRALN